MALLYPYLFISDVFYKEGIFGFSLGSKWWTFLYIYTQDIPVGIQITTLHLFLLILQSDPTLRF